MRLRLAAGSDKHHRSSHAVENWSRDSLMAVMGTLFGGLVRVQLNGIVGYDGHHRTNYRTQLRWT